LKSGEIDVAEYFTVWPKRVFPVVRYHHKGDDPTAHNEKCTLPRPEAFHTYTARWTPDRIELKVDGKTCVSTAWTMGDGLSRPSPFDKPFFLALFQALGSSKAGYDPEDAPDFPVTMDVDHVYIWGHVSD
jgi:beta-glucanase (GH16 family)